MNQINIPFVAVHNKGLEIKNISKTYNKKKVVNNVSIKLNRGESVALLGPNGAGKTTLFYMIMGLIGSDSGSILLDKNEISELPMYRRSKLGIGYLPQESSVFRGLNVEENILAILQKSLKTNDETKKTLEKLLSDFGHNLPEFDVELDNPIETFFSEMESSLKSFSYLESIFGCNLNLSLIKSNFFC